MVMLASPVASGLSAVARAVVDLTQAAAVLLSRDQAAWQFTPLTLTAIYASYAAGGLATLLTMGRLSDYLGRRPVLSVGLGIQAVAMLLFVFAGDVLWLFLAAPEDNLFVAGDDDEP
jgi:MFS family permease